MQKSKCPCCPNTIFEVVSATTEIDEVTVIVFRFVQCDKCGTVVGIIDQRLRDEVNLLGEMIMELSKK